MQTFKIKKLKTFRAAVKARYDHIKPRRGTKEANDFAKRVVETAKTLDMMPNRHELDPVTGLRRLEVPKTGQAIDYYVDDDDNVVLVDLTPK